jgi:phosphoribosylamine--glycine ligase
MRRKGIQVIPSAMDWDPAAGVFKSDGTRVAFLNANMSVKDGERRGQVAEKLRNRLYAAFNNGKIRVIPREDAEGNRLDVRRDVAAQYQSVEDLFGR